MNSKEQEITQWLGGLKRGESHAQAVIWEQIFERVVRMARRKLEHQGLERRTRDEEDIALSAIRCLFQKASSGGFEQLEDSTHLWKLLAKFTKGKVNDDRKKHHALKRGGSGQDKIHTFEENVLGVREEGGGIEQVLGHETTPEIIMAMDEAVAALPAELQPVAVYRLEGKNDKQIAQALNVSVKTIQRRLKSIEQHWRIDR